MTSPQYEGYSVHPITVRLREKFGKTNIYNRPSKGLLTKATGFIQGYDFTLNPYRGCQYGCSYCYAAAFSPNSKMRQDWGNWVIVKQNAVELLEKELKRWHKKYPDQSPKIYMSSVTDPYQPIESKEQITRQLLAVLVEYQPQLVIQTRSPMIVRDLDLLQQFKQLRINMSIPTGSERVKRDFEPQSPSIKSRFNAMGKLKYNLPFNAESQVYFTITVTPLLPIFPEDAAKFIFQLEIADRVVIQGFHQHKKQSLTASTRKEAIALQQKYSWWYDNEESQYLNFKQSLEAMLGDVEIIEGKPGFSYD
ncbi:MAG: radical SAM protein [Microcoleaceae cyanobacterium]